MVTVDDATYVKMKDTLYGGDAGKASRAKAQIEANYDDAKYNDFMNQLNSMGGTSSNNSGPADGYATATDRNMATNGSEFGRNNQTSSETPSVVKEETKTETVTETPEVKQEGALKPLSQDYYNQTSQDAQDKIVKNLNDYKKSNPEYFTDYESFKRNFSYDARDDVQKNTLDEWYKGYQEGLSLASTPTTDLYTQYKNGDLSDAQLQNLRVSDPTKYSELMSQINTGNIVAAYDDDKGMDITGNSIQEMAYQAAQQMFMQWMSGDTDNGASQYFREYEEKMESPEMKGLSDQCTEVQEQIENLQDDIASMKEEVEREYAGTGASRAKINAIIADRTYDLQLQLRTANSEYNKYATQYNNRMQQYQNEFQLGLQEYQINQQARQQQMNELGFAMDLMSFETPQQQQERQWEFWVKQQEYQNGNINSKDYQTRYKAALTSVQNLLSQYEGIPMVRSAEEMAQDILKAIDNGSDLGTELTKINKLIQSKDEYKYLYNNTFKGATGPIQDSMQIGNTEWYKYNDKRYTAAQLNSMFGDYGKANYTVVSEDKLKTYSDGRAGTFGSFMAKSQNNDGQYVGQCGKFVNNYLQEIGAGRPFGNEDINTRKGWINSDEGKVGTIAVFDYNHYIDGKNYGHVAIVVSAPDKNGDLWVKDANYDSDGVVHTRKVNIKDASLQGFIDPTISQDYSRGTSGTSGTASTSSSSNLSSNSDTNIPTKVDISNLGISQSQLDSLAKDYINGERSYTDLDKTYGSDILNAVGKRALELTEGGYEKSMKITDPNKILQAEKDYLTKFNSMNDASKEALDWAEKMNVALNAIDEDKRNNKKTLNGASQTIVTAFNKLLDPNSVVRESEYARTPEGQALFAQIEGKIEQVTKGGAGLTYDNLKGLVDLANQLTASYEKQQNELAQLIKNNADTYGLNINNILPISVIESLNKNSQVSSGGIQDSNFYKTYANTSKSSGTITLSNGQSFQWDD